jgi:hypothetical protein
MQFLDNLWKECSNNKKLDKFSICLFKQHYIELYFSSVWPLDKLKLALGLNIADGNKAGWKVYSITKNEFDFSPYVDLFNRDQQGKLYFKDNADVAAFYDSLHDVFRVYDFSNKRAAVIYPSNPEFNEWEIHSPLREFFHIWALKNNALLIHSGIVSSGGKAVLLPGAGGSGKSTTTLSCLSNDMQTTGDDYNLIFNDNGVIRAYPLYGNVKLKIPKPGQHVFDLPIINGWQSETLSYAQKKIYFPPTDSKIWDKTYPELVGILCPMIPSIEAAHASITHIKMVELINRLSISSIMQSPFMAKEYLAMSVLLAKHVKIAYLNLSKDLNENVKCIKKWIATNS